MNHTPSGTGVYFIEAGGASLAAGGPPAGGGPPAPPGALFVRSARGGLAVHPGASLDVVFGRGEEDVHVPVGVGDRFVSRRHGDVREHDGRWVLANHGKLPLRMPGSELLLAGASATLDPGYTPVLLKHRDGPAHVLEIFVVPHSAPSATAASYEATLGGAIWRLDAEERITLIVLGQRYLRSERYAQPLSAAQTAQDLATVTGDGTWGARRVERLVERVRKRLSAAGVPGLTRDEVGEPVGNALNHNLISELLLTTTLVPPDLTEIDTLDW